MADRKTLIRKMAGRVKELLCSVFRRDSVRKYYVGLGSYPDSDEKTDKALQVIGETCGGATADPVKGAWKNPATGKCVSEPVTIFTVSTSSGNHRKALHILKKTFFREQVIAVETNYRLKSFVNELRVEPINKYRLLQEVSRKKSHRYAEFFLEVDGSWYRYGVSLVRAGGRRVSPQPTEDAGSCLRRWEKTEDPQTGTRASSLVFESSVPLVFVLETNRDFYETVREDLRIEIVGKSGLPRPCVAERR